MDTSDARQLVRQLIDAESSSHYALVRRIPSIEIWQTLAYLDSLDESERDTLFDLWAERGIAMLTPVDYDRQMEIVQNPAYQRFCNGKMAASAWTYGDTDLVQSKKARATDIRRELKQQFRDPFEIDPTNVGGGVWEYAGNHQGHEFTLTIDYGGFINFRYGIATSRLPKRGATYGVAWEGLLGFGLSGWDYVCPNNLSESVSLLGDIIEKLVPLLEEIPYEH